MEGIVFGGWDGVERVVVGILAYTAIVVLVRISGKRTLTSMKPSTSSSTSHSGRCSRRSSSRVTSRSSTRSRRFSCRWACSSPSRSRHRVRRPSRGWSGPNPRCSSTTTGSCTRRCGGSGSARPRSSRHSDRRAPRPWRMRRRRAQVERQSLCHPEGRPRARRPIRSGA